MVGEAKGMIQKCWLCGQTAKAVVEKYPEIKPKYGEYTLGNLEIPFAGISVPLCRICTGLIMQVVQQNWETLKMNAEIEVPPPLE